jgi:RNA 3'-terminal phosphate cyclase (ATP)
MPSPGKGTFILLKAEFTSGASACYTALGAPGKPAEQVTDEAVHKLVSFLETHTCLDHYLADQLLLPLSLVNGTSWFSTNCITQHLLTNAHVISQFLPVNIDISGEPDQPGLISVRGLDIKSYILDNNNKNNES